MDTQYQKIKSLTLKRIAYAMAAADEGNVTAAARKLHVSQPAVSSAIAALEQHYGIRLFTRLPAQGITLTSFGTMVMSEARLLCDQAQTIALLASPDAKIAGEVGLCCYEAIAPYVVPRLLRRLEKRLPEVSVRLTEANLENTAASLKHGRTDLAITYDLGLEGDVYQQALYSSNPMSSARRITNLRGVKSLDLPNYTTRRLSCWISP